MLLLHEFYGRKFLLPDHLTYKEREGLNKRKAEAMDGPEPEAAGPGKTLARALI